MLVFAEDIALISDNIKDAITLLHKVVEAAEKIGLHINEGKMEFISLNEQGKVLSRKNKPIKQVDDFQYLGSWLNTTQRDVEGHISKAWAAYKRMNIIWKSNLDRKIKHHFFRASVESILLYGSESWTVTTKIAR